MSKEMRWPSWQDFFSHFFVDGPPEDDMLPTKFECRFNDRDVEHLAKLLTSPREAQQLVVIQKLKDLPGYGYDSFLGIRRKDGTIPHGHSRLYTSFLRVTFFPLAGTGTDESITMLWTLWNLGAEMEFGLLVFFHIHKLIPNEEYYELLRRSREECDEKGVCFFRKT